MGSSKRNDSASDIEIPFHKKSTFTRIANGRNIALQKFRNRKNCRLKIVAIGFTERAHERTMYEKSRKIETERKCWKHSFSIWPGKPHTSTKFSKISRRIFAFTMVLVFLTLVWYRCEGIPMYRRAVEKPVIRFLGCSTDLSPWLINITEGRNHIWL